MGVFFMEDLMLKDFILFVEIAYVVAGTEATLFMLKSLWDVVGNPKVGREEGHDALFSSFFLTSIFLTIAAGALASMAERLGVLEAFLVVSAVQLLVSELDRRAGR